MHRLFIHILVLLGVILLLSLPACTLDDTGLIRPDAQPQECIDLPPPPGWLGIWNTLNPTNGIESFCINPNDPNEIVANYWNLQSESSGVYIYNVQTLERRLLLPEAASFLQWGNSGWILLGGQRIKPNGDSLTSLHFRGLGARPIWNPAGNRIAAFISDPANSSGYYIVDFDGNIQDTIPAIAAGDWYAEDSILGYQLDHNTGEQSIHIMEISTKKLQYIMPVPQETANDRNWVWQMRMFKDHDRAAILTGNGLWLISTKNKTVKHLAPSCDNNRIFSICLHPNNRYIYIEQNAFVQVDSFTVKHIMATIMLDAETGEHIDTLFYASGN